MSLSRRDFVKLGTGAGAAALVGWRTARAPGAQSGLLVRTIPSSGESIPVVGIGTARRYDVGPTDAEWTTLGDVLQRFAELGGKLVDTAPSYGRAEVAVGDLVADRAIRERLFLATKVRTRGRDEGVAQMETSFERLHTDRIDLMQVHNLVDVETQLATLREWKAAGRFRYIGMTTSSQRQYERFEAVMGREEMDFVQLNYSLARRGAEERLLPLAADRGMGVLVNLPYGRGRLFRAVGERILPDWAAEFDCASWGQFFLKFIVSHPAVTCVIPGTAKMEYLLDNMGAARGRLPDVEMRRRMTALYDAL